MTRHTYESLQVGDAFSFTRTISQADVQAFADVSGDDNPLHIDPEFAATTQFGKPIVHGVFLLGVVSKVLGRDFPGHGSVAVALSAKFLRPVVVDSEITVEVKIAEKVENRKHIRAKIYVYCNGKMCVGGEATLIPPSDAA
ncbi:MAG: MaoC family dehydratase [Rhodothermales bacterium]